MALNTPIAKMDLDQHSTLKAARDALRAAGLRVTRPRAAVLAWLSEHPHASVEHISSGVRHWLGSISIQALYDMLAACTSAGLVRRIEPAGHPARYERRTGDNHHHAVCRTCGRIEDVDCALGARPCLTPPDDRGFAVDEAEIVYWGHCPRCLAGATTISEMGEVSALDESHEQHDHQARRHSND